MKSRICLLLCAMVSFPTFAQTIQVNQQNKTIYVSAEGGASLQADVAIVTVGYECYAIDDKTAYQDVASHSESILSAIEKIGVEKEQIRTGNLSLQRSDPDEHWSAEMSKSRQFEASQSWKIRVQAKDAETIVNAAMSAGANRLSNIDWAYSDPVKLQAEASKAALSKARRVAEEMAKGLNAKLGELVYASNTAPVVSQYLFPRSLNTATASISRNSQVVSHKIILYPEKVDEKTTVYAVFAIE
jgi:uncharacterized protein